MTLDALTAVSPIDGRYRSKTECLADYFSEYALIRYRVRVEIEYLSRFASYLYHNWKALTAHFLNSYATSIATSMRLQQHVWRRLRVLPITTLKAVEYFIKEEFDKIGGLDDYKEFIHFGLTSQDINNTSVPLSVKEALEEVFYPQVEELIAQLKEYAEAWKDVPMLAKTHGQPASPTRLGKEVEVYVYRLSEQLATLRNCKMTAKFGGATGNFNAHHVAYPQHDWRAFGNRFVSEKLGLERGEVDDTD